MWRLVCRLSGAAGNAASLGTIYEPVRRLKRPLMKIVM